MNIIKIKDTYLTDEILQLTDEQRKIFNEKFRDHYVNVINWTYCIPIEELSSLSEIISLSQALCKRIDADGTTDNFAVQNTSLTNDMPMLRSMSDAAGIGDFTLCTDFDSIKNDLSKYEFVLLAINSKVSYTMCSAKSPNDTAGTRFNCGQIQNYSYSSYQKTLSESILPSDTIVFNINKYGTDVAYTLTHQCGDELHHIAGSESASKVYCGTLESVTDYEFRWKITNNSDGSINILTHSDERYLKYNTSSKWFSVYSSTSGSVVQPALYYREIQQIKIDPDVDFKEHFVTVPFDEEQYLMDLVGEQAYCEGTYTTSDETIATVDEYGIVTFVAPGTVDITFTTKETDIYNSISISYSLSISTTDPGLYWTNEEIKDEKYSVIDGKSYDSVAASIYDDYDGKITYVSYDESVATIDENGFVITHNAGETYIEATGSGSKKYTDSSIDYLLTVTYNPLKKYDWLLYQTLIDLNLIDIETTEKINDLNKFIEFNKFSYTDSELTFDDVRVFRTWLAKTLYNVLSHEEDIDVLEMLNYYANEMNDCTIQHLNLFNIDSSTDVISNINKSTCGCQRSTVEQTSLSSCDPIAVYRKSVYEKMVSVFGDIDFWLQREDDLLKEIKKYIDFIIFKNLPLVQSEYVTNLHDCGCLSDTNIEQTELMQIMKNLSVSLGYLINNEAYSHKNFIGETLNKWSSLLYEKMIW